MADDTVQQAINDVTENLWILQDKARSRIVRWFLAIDRVAYRRGLAQSSSDQQLRKALSDLLAHVDHETCTHEDTHRGGMLWTICDSCGRKWADDEGGFMPHQDSPAVARVRRILAAPLSLATVHDEGRDGFFAERNGAVRMSRAIQNLKIGGKAIAKPKPILTTRKPKRRSHSFTGRRNAAQHGPCSGLSPATTTNRTCAPPTVLDADCSRLSRYGYDNNGIRLRQKLDTTADEADAAGRAAYHAGLPCDAPDYGREDRRARWRCGWKREQAASGAGVEALRVLEAKISAERLAWIDAMTSGQTPMEQWQRHTGVSTWADLEHWAKMKQREILIIRSARDGEDGPSKDELGDYLVGKDAVLAELLANMRQIKERSYRKS